ncbi:MAG: endolytic transglycosylase MltG [Campylobacterota bacterium]|nr:endolytic transglycosylase MltG [Campylobacterota bacterium]
MRQYKRFIVLGSIVLVLLSIPVVYNLFPINHLPKTFYIASSNIDDVTKTLKENGYTVTWIERWMMQRIDVPAQGWYHVDTEGYGRFDFFSTLYQKKAKTMSVVIYAGETAVELTSRLANDMKLDQKKLLAYYHKHTLFNEADIFAGRYAIARRADENRTMSYLFDVSKRHLAEYVVEHFKEVPEILELKILFTMASIIQKESNDVKEMPLISSVIYNRLEKDMKLQMDSTLNYGKFSHTIVTPERIRTDKSYYNTYKHKGLPLQPLGSVTMDAFNAAMYPLSSEYLFFMLSPMGGHRFSATYAEHLENVRAFRVYQKKREQDREEERTLARKKAP